MLKLTFEKPFSSDTVHQKYIVEYFVKFELSKTKLNILSVC